MYFHLETTLSCLQNREKSSLKTTANPTTNEKLLKNYVLNESLFHTPKQLKVYCVDTLLIRDKVEKGRDNDMSAEDAVVPIFLFQYIIIGQHFFLFIFIIIIIIMSIPCRLRQDARPGL